MVSPIDLFLLVGRIVFGGYFLWSGFNHFRHLDAMTQYAASKGTPAPKAAVAGTGLLLLAGGASIVVGYFPLVGLALVAVFLIGVTPVMHAFWKISDPMARMGEQVNFSKNVTLLGATLALTALGQPWPFSP